MRLAFAVVVLFALAACGAQERPTNALGMPELTQADLDEASKPSGTSSAQADPAPPGQIDVTYTPPPDPEPPPPPTPRPGDKPPHTVKRGAIHAAQDTDKK